MAPRVLAPAALVVAAFLFGILLQDGVRGTRVMTNAYDVSRGRFE